MVESVRKFISSQRGDVGIYVLLIFLVGILVIFSGSIAFVWRFWIIKNQVGQGLHKALVQSANSASSYSMQNEFDTGSNQMVIDQDDAENTFNSVLALDIGLSSNQYTVDNFTVYGPADQGKPLPDGYPGVVPGTSLYAHITVEIPIGDLVGLPSLSGVTYYLPIEELVSANRFMDNQGQWQGG